MMSLRKKMNLKKVCLTVGCFLTIGMMSLAESNAGVIPWTYNAIFGPTEKVPWPMVPDMLLPPIPPTMVDMA